MRFAGNFVVLTLVACLDVIVNLRANAFPVKGLRYGVDGSRDSGVS